MAKHDLNGVGQAREGWWKKQVPYYITGGFLVIYLGLKLAEYAKDGNFISALLKINKINWGFPIVLNSTSAKSVCSLLFVYLFIILYIVTAKKWTRKGPKGSAEWSDPQELNSAYNVKFSTPPENFVDTPKIMTQNVAIGYNDFNHRRNLNTLVIGGSGAGKTRFYAKPNLLQGNVSFVCLDPKGELLRETGEAMKAMGYNVKVLNLINMKDSDRYNPFEYLQSETDIMRLCTNLFKATGDNKGSGSPDPFWDNAAMALLMALVSYLHYEAPPEEQNFAMIGKMLRAGAITSESMGTKTPLDKLFDELDNDHLAKKFYRDYHVGGAKTLQSIQITLSARLNKFNIDELQDLTRFDMLDLKSLGERRTVLYALIPDNDTSFNFIVSILYTQLFQTLMNSADFAHGGRLPVPVHFLMDEFANVALPDDFDKILATIRSRKISVSIIIQNMAQIKALYEKQWESIVGNCDEMIYLGGNEQGTFEYINKALGKETIDLTTYGQTRGRNGSSSSNFNFEARDLMTIDEIRVLDNSYAILFIKGEKPCLDKKYDLLKHPNINLGPDGKYGNKLNYKRSEISLFVFDDENVIDKSMADILSKSDFPAIEGYSAKRYIDQITGGLYA